MEKVIGGLEAPNHDYNRAEMDEIMRAVRRLSSKAAGIVCGLVFGLVISAATVILLLKGGEEVGPHLALLGEFYPGYTVTWGGAILGFLYGFATGFFSGWIVGWVYNSVVLFKSHRQRA